MSKPHAARPLVGTEGREGWMRGPCACPRADAIRWRHETRMNRVASRTGTRPPPFHSSTPCPYRRMAKLMAFARFGCQSSSGRARFFKTAPGDRLRGMTDHNSSALMKSAARSPIMTMVVCVLADGMEGMIEPSAMRKPSTPYTLRCGSTTARRSTPILQEPTK